MQRKHVVTCLHVELGNFGQQSAVLFVHRIVRSNTGILGTTANFALRVSLEHIVLNLNLIGLYTLLSLHVHPIRKDLSIGLI